MDFAQQNEFWIGGYSHIIITLHSNKKVPMMDARLPPPGRTIRDSYPSYGSSFSISYVICSFFFLQNICALKTHVRLASITRE